ncbi:hypothetical protein TRFO_42608 [Tritrichomonas foetus]|uniref:Thioredoxin domain-containing protein n=1 Tax=Tritrichomonas foetus TaxID=1144522 RepID=A0A1J4KVC8_9EUKA|nr:hypothetical protein TRFO_42608 [Tritrichomonas foetus]|eukprot:OHT15273.1 hypothetical protein TRFO_42608 [Tritrichomonas foetus]
MFLSFLLLFRIREPIGEFQNIPLIEKVQDLESFVNSHKTVLVFCQSNDPSQKMDYASYSISKYKKQISFVKVPHFVAEELNVSILPDILGYQQGKPVNDTNQIGIQNVFGISSFCEYLLGKRIIQLNSPEELRQLFESHKTSIIGVDGAPVPKGYPKTDLFYQAPSAIFRYFNISVTNGIYVYRPADRQLVRAQNNNYKSYSRTNVVELSQVDVSSRKYIAGYFISTGNATLTSNQMQILNTLGSKFSQKNENFFFAPLVGKSGMVFYRAGSFVHFKIPFFMVMETGAVPFSPKRWAVMDSDKMYDIDYLEKFLQRIENGEEPPTVVSEEVSSSNPSKIVNKEYFGKIMNDNSESVVIFYKENHPANTRVELTIQKAQELLKSENVKFYFFDLSKNDYPQKISQIERIPFMVQYAKGTAERPAYYRGSFDIGDVIEWTSNHASKHFDVKFDSQKVQAEIQDAVQKKMKSGDAPNYDEL